jgi:transposase-like protein
MIQDKIKELYLSLSKEDRELLLKELHIVSFDLPVTEGLVDSCPHCKASRVVKYGTHKGDQRYQCKSCGRTFNAITGTAIGKIIKKNEFLACQNLMLTEGYMSLEKIAQKLNISIPTAFSWRHKILLSLPELSSKFEGDTEIDDLWFLYSQKGRKGLDYSRKRGGTKHRGDNDFQVKVLATANKEQLDLKVVKIGRLSQADIQRSMGNKFNKKTTLVSDKHQSIAAFANSAKIKHESFKASDHITSDGKGVQRVNNVAQRLKTTINRTLHGVSTKYLQMYANWFKAIENYKDKGVEVFQKTMLSNKTTWDVYVNVEKVYERFINNHSVRTYRCPVVNRVKAANWNQHVIIEYPFI